MFQYTTVESNGSAYFTSQECRHQCPQPVSSSSTNTVLIVLVIIAILLTSTVAGVWLVKKYVCGGRFLVHRYSVMRDSVEANKIEGVDDVDTNYMETAKAQYNEDSDQDLLA